jgi:hypothetical protein
MGDIDQKSKSIDTLVKAVYVILIIDLEKTST